MINVDDLFTFVFSFMDIYASYIPTSVETDQCDLFHNIYVPMDFWTLSSLVCIICVWISSMLWKMLITLKVLVTTIDALGHFETG